MPPKKSSQRSSQATLETALEKLCEEIGKEKMKVANIKALEVLPTVKEGLRAARKSSQLIDDSFIGELFNALDNTAQDLCSRLDPPLFSVIVDIVLQAEYRVEGERIIHLLTASLFRDSKAVKTQRTLQSRKDSIGKESMRSILTYFLDRDNYPGLRRWVGLLCIQLLQDSEENIERLGFTSENSRRQIGIIVASEPNETVRTVAGQLVKLLLTTKFELADLWPVDIDKVMYTGFPSSSQDNKGWSSAFQDYIDFLYDQGYVKSDGIGQLYFATLFQLRPEHPFGVRDHNIDVFIYGKMLTIHAPGRGASLDQILDIPLDSLSRVTIIRDAYSQHQKQGMLQLELFEHGNSRVYLDAEPINLREMHLIVKEDSLRSIKIQLSQLCPNLKILENATEMPQSSDELNRSSQRTGVSFIMRVDGGGSNSETEETAEKDLPDTQQGSAISVEASVEIQDDNDDIDMEDIYDASPRTQKSQPVEPPTQESMKPPPKLNPRNKKAVKPKAKKPIITAQRHGDDSTKLPASSPHVLNEPLKEGSKSVWDIDEDKVQVSSQKAAKNARKTNPSSKKTPVAKSQSQSKSNSRPSASISAKASTRVPTTTSQGKKAINRFGDDSITSPDMNDASTPKIANSGRSFKTATATSAKPTQSINQKSKNDASKSAPRKKYSVQRVLGASTATAVDAESAKAGTGPKSKTSKATGKFPTKDVKTSVSQAKAAVKGLSKKQIGEKADTNKRKSAPATMERIVPTRVSQRKAATRANAKLQEVDTIEDEEKEIEGAEVPKVTKSKPEPNKGTSPEKERAPRRKAKSDATHDFQKIGAVEDNEVIFQSQQEDARSLGLVAEELLTSDDDLYGASPKRTIAAPDMNIARKNKVTEEKKVEKSSNVDFVSSLVDIVDDLFGEPPEGFPVLQNGSEQKPQRAPAKTDSPRKKVKATLETREQETLSIPTEIAPTSLGKAQETEQYQEVFTGDEPPVNQFSPKTPMGAEPTLIAPPPTKVSPEKELIPEYFPEAAAEGIPDAVSPAASHSPEREVPAPEESPGSDQIIALGEANPQQENNADVSAQKESSAGDQAIALSMINIEKVPVVTEKEERSDNSPLSEPPKSPPFVLPPLLLPALPAIVEKELNQSQKRETKELSLNLVEARHEQRKRKATAAEATPPKRRRAEPKKTPVIGFPSPVEGNRVKKDKSPKARSRPTTEKSTSPAMRRSPRLAERKNIFEMSKVDTSLVDDAVSRKPTIVAFGTKGARNQGLPPLHGKEAHEHSTPAPTVVKVRKRKVDDAQSPNAQSPPNKRQSCSPKQPEEMDHSLPQLPVFDSSPPVPTFKEPTNRRKNSRPSSQSSRVDVNGSPIANTTSQDDHISKLKERLAEDIRARKRSQNVATTTELVAEQGRDQSKDNVEAAIETLPVEAPAQPRARRPSEIFGPRIRLENKPKALPSSPETAAAQYLPHKKTGKGRYEAVGTKEVIALDKPLADPFANNTKKASDFTERLRAGVSNGQQRKSLRFNQEDPEKTLVDVENLANHKQYSRSDPSDMTTGTSVESGSSEPSRSPLKERRNEMWNMAIRPHYKSLHEAVHRIADEMIIHLAKEEDKAGLLVGQYKQNGTKILDNLTRKRETERATILQKLNQKKKEMVSIYAEAKEFVMETAEDLKDSIGHFEKDWRKQQQAVHEKISEGRKSSDKMWCSETV